LLPPQLILSNCDVLINFLRTKSLNNLLM